MKFILIVLIAYGWSAQTPISMQEFDSRENCQNAGAVVVKMYNKQTIRWACVPK